MKTRKLRIKRKVVVKSRKKGKLNRKISYRSKQRKSMVRSQKRNSRNNFKKRFSRKMRGGTDIEKTQNFYKSYGLGWKNASFTVTYNPLSKIMMIKWDSNTYPDGLTIDFNIQSIDVDGKTVNVVDGSNKTKIVQLYSNRIANDFKAFLDSFTNQNPDETTGEVEITAADLVEAIGRKLYHDPEYKSYKKKYQNNIRDLSRSHEMKELFIAIARSLDKIINLTPDENKTIKKEIVHELEQHIGNGDRFIAQQAFGFLQQPMYLTDLLYYKWENDIYEGTIKLI